jgi:hypothetical protein
MTTPAERLVQARVDAGFSKPKQAWAAMRGRGIKVAESTYYGHERGTDGFSRVIGLYARFFGVTVDWLLTGKGEMKPAPRSYHPPAIPMMGKVGAGGRVGPIDTDGGHEPPDHIEWPDPAYIGALEVDGDSQVPRYLHGEVILYDRRGRAPAELLNQYAVVDCLDGRRMVKMLRRASRIGPMGDLWKLESLNAPAEDNVRLLTAYEIWPRARR